MSESPKVPGYLVDALIGVRDGEPIWAGRVATSLDAVALQRLELPRDADVGAARAEVARLAALSHPNLLRVHELVPSARGAVLVLELAPGGTLGDLIAGRGHLQPGEVVSALAPIADALGYLHERGLVHGGISPDRILFTADGQPKLTGLAADRVLGTRGGKAAAASVDPTVASGYPPSRASDVFMLAAVAVHALTGTPLWRGDTPDTVLLTALTSDLSDIGARLATVGVREPMSGVLHAALALSPNTRPSAAQLSAELRRCAPAIALEVRAPEPSPAVIAHSVSPDRSVKRRRSTARAATTATMGVIDRLDGPEPSGPAVTFAEQEPPPLVVPERTGSGGGHRIGRGGDRRPGWLPAAAAVAVLLIGGAVAWGVIDSASRPSRPPTASSSLPAAPAPLPAVDGSVESLSSAIESLATAAAGTSAAPSTLGPGTTLTVAQVGQVLAQLDALREGAYADRAALLLTGVYATGALLDEDTASLQRIVPSGCGLEGVHTTYTNIMILSQTLSTIALSADATLTPSVLFCNGVAKAQAPGSGPTALQITLIRSGSKFLISSVTS